MGGTMDSEELKKRTKLFALAVIRFVESLPRGKTADVMGGQLLRAGTSVAANYRSACRARSRRDFVSKITIVEEEADESSFWLEMFLEAGIVDRTTISWLLSEAKELTAIFTASGRTATDRASLNSQLTMLNSISHSAPAIRTAELRPDPGWPLSMQGRLQRPLR